MTVIDHVRPRFSVSRRVPLATPRRPSVELMSEGVVAAYLHDISTRHAHDPLTPRRAAAESDADAGPVPA